MTDKDKEGFGKRRDGRFYVKNLSLSDLKQDKKDTRPTYTPEEDIELGDGKIFDFIKLELEKIPVLMANKEIPIERLDPVLDEKGNEHYPTAHTDGKVIRVPADCDYFDDVGRKSYWVKAITAHESGHCAYNSFDIMDEARNIPHFLDPNVPILHDPTFQYFMNVADDGRIENEITKNSPGWADWIDWTNSVCGELRPSIDIDRNTLALIKGFGYSMDDIELLNAKAMLSNATLKQVKKAYNDYATKEPNSPTTKNLLTKMNELLKFRKKRDILLADLKKKHPEIFQIPDVTKSGRPVGRPRTLWDDKDVTTHNNELTPALDDAKLKRKKSKSDFCNEHIQKTWKLRTTIENCPDDMNDSKNTQWLELLKTSFGISTYDLQEIDTWVKNNPTAFLVGRLNVPKAQAEVQEINLINTLDSSKRFNIHDSSFYESEYFRNKASEMLIRKRLEVLTKNDKRYAAPSDANSLNSYSVTQHVDDSWNCTCPDHVIRGNSNCKHIQRGKMGLLKKEIKSMKPVGRPKTVGEDDKTGGKVGRPRVNFYDDIPPMKDSSAFQEQILQYSVSGKSKEPIREIYKKTFKESVEILSKIKKTPTNKTKELADLYVKMYKKFRDRFPNPDQEWARNLPPSDREIIVIDGSPPDNVQQGGMDDPNAPIVIYTQPPKTPPSDDEKSGEKGGNNQDDEKSMKPVGRPPEKKDDEQGGGKRGSGQDDDDKSGEKSGKSKDEENKDIGNNKGGKQDKNEGSGDSIKSSGKQNDSKQSDDKSDESQKSVDSPSGEPGGESGNGMTGESTEGKSSGGENSDNSSSPENMETKFEEITKEIIRERAEEAKKLDELQEKEGESLERDSKDDILEEEIKRMKEGLKIEPKEPEAIANFENPKNKFEIDRQNRKEMERIKKATEKILRGENNKFTEEDVQRIKNDLKSDTEKIKAEINDGGGAGGGGEMKYIDLANKKAKLNSRAKKIATALSGLKESILRSKHFGTKGRINTQRYATQLGKGVKPEDMTPFIRKKDEEVGVGINLLIDTSGSMSSTQINTAIQVAKDVSIGVEEVIGTKCSVITFSSDYNVMKEQDQKAKDVNWYALGGGGTNMTSALEASIKRTSESNDSNMIFLLTDGNPNSLDTTLQKIQECRKKKIRLLIGFIDMHSPSLQQYLKNTEYFHVRTGQLDTIPQILSRWVNLVKKSF